MKQYSLIDTIQNTITLIPNTFIDEHMAKANGEFVKVYLYLQRHYAEMDSLTVSIIADHLHLTEADVNRALSYWETESVLCSKDSLAAETCISEEEPVMEVLPSYTIPKKKEFAPVDLSKHIEQDGLSQLSYMVDTYLGKPLNVSELNSLYYLYEGLHFSIDLIEYVIEYCVTNQKKSMRYIEAVAINWYEQGIRTVADAKEQVQSYNKNYFSVMKTMGLSMRNPSTVEAKFIDTWLNEYKLDLSIILEACTRTITAISQPSFPYTDSILKAWAKAGVRNSADIEKLDQIHIKQQKTKKESNPAQKSENKFHNFNQRNYDYDALEAQLTKL